MSFQKIINIDDLIMIKAKHRRTMISSQVLMVCLEKTLSYLHIYLETMSDMIELGKCRAL